MPDFIIPAINQEKTKFAFSKNSTMVDFRKPVPAYLNEKGNIIRLILFTALFALVFINIYAPFGADRWFDVNQLEFFTYSSLVILAGVLVVVISRIIMYYHGRRHVINYYRYFAWIFGEILLMALFYALFETFVLKDTRSFHRHCKTIGS